MASTAKKISDLNNDKTVHTVTVVYYDGTSVAQSYRVMSGGVVGGFYC